MPFTSFLSPSPQTKLDVKTERSVEVCRVEVVQALARATTREGARREPPAPSRSPRHSTLLCSIPHYSTHRVLELNTGLAPEDIEEKQEEEVWGEVVVGEGATRIPTNLPYNLHFPFRCH